MRDRVVAIATACLTANVAQRAAADVRKPDATDREVQICITGVVGGCAWLAKALWAPRDVS